MNRQRLQAIGDFLQREYIDSGRFPGASLAIMHRGALVHRTVHGFADIAGGRAMAADTIVRIYSMTKPITSVALMMLVEDGRVQLDDPVERFVPEWRDLGVWVAGTIETGFRTRRPDRPMQVVDLLRHTAGLTYGFQYSSNIDAAYRAKGIGEVQKSGTLDGMIADLAAIPLAFSPGDGWLYSVATDVVGWLVQVISGQPFEEFVHERILGPLGMADTGFAVRDGQESRLASCYVRGADGALVVQDDCRTSSFLRPPAFVSGGGGLVSTADDYLKFLEALRTGAPRLVGRKTLALMTANHLPGGRRLHEMSRSAFSEAAYDGIGFGLGFATTVDSPATLIAGSNGDWFWGGAASTFFFVDPAEALSVVFLTQFLPSSLYPVRRQLRSMIHAALD
jgi:CubicO group peptidase (beta-lactamase class C family)